MNQIIKRKRVPDTIKLLMRIHKHVEEFEERFGVVNFIDEFIDGMDYNPNSYLLRFVYPLSIHQKDIIDISISSIKNSTYDMLIYGNKKIVNIDMEDLELLMAAIVLKFEKVNIEKLYEST